jgi:tRNA threonylcarbamoyladenosine biosynthesis protein TsaB
MSEHFLLHLETSTNICSVAISSGSILIDSITVNEGLQHAEVLSPAIDQLLKNTSIARKHLSAVSVSMGPGSFTGLRIGMSTAKGICYGLGVPLIGINTLYALAHAYSGQCHPIDGSLVIPMIDARRMEVYTSCYDHALNQIWAEQPLVLTSCSFETLGNTPIHIIGDGATKAKTLYQAEKFITIHENFLCHAAHLIAPAFFRFHQKQFDNLASLEPNYGKPASVER